MECSCKLWPMPGMYVVTSTEFVKRTRATLRNAEFGFFGVCVYTRMHTPRFSGQPISAGDFVLTCTFSRPIRTNCENVGTVFPQSRAEIFVPGHPQQHEREGRGSRKARTQNCARAHSKAERSTANPEKNPQQETPYAFQKAEFASGFDSERLTRLCGAGAPFRPLFRPIPSYFVPGLKIFLPTTTTGLIYP